MGNCCARPPGFEDAPASKGAVSPSRPEAAAAGAPSGGGGGGGGGSPLGSSAASGDAHFLFGSKAAAGGLARAPSRRGGAGGAAGAAVPPAPPGGLAAAAEAAEGGRGRGEESGGAAAPASSVVRVPAARGGGYAAKGPTEAEVRAHAVHLGMRPDKDFELLWIAEQALLAPLPDGWEEWSGGGGGAEGQVATFFYNTLTGVSSWTHPLEEHFRGLYLRQRTDRGWRAKSFTHALSGDDPSAQAAKAEGAGTLERVESLPKPDGGEAELLTSLNHTRGRLLGLSSEGLLPPAAAPGPPTRVDNLSTATAKENDDKATEAAANAMGLQDLSSARLPLPLFDPQFSLVKTELDESRLEASRRGRAAAAAKAAEAVEGAEAGAGAGATTEGAPEQPDKRAALSASLGARDALGANLAAARRQPRPLTPMKEEEAAPPAAEENAAAPDAAAAPGAEAQRGEVAESERRADLKALANMLRANASGTRHLYSSPRASTPPVARPEHLSPKSFPIELDEALAAKQQDKWRAQMAHASGQCNAEGVPLPPRPEIIAAATAQQAAEGGGGAQAQSGEAAAGEASAQQPRQRPSRRGRKGKQQAKAKAQAQQEQQAQQGEPPVLPESEWPPLPSAGASPTAAAPAPAAEPAIASMRNPVPSGAPAPPVHLVAHVPNFGGGGWGRSALTNAAKAAEIAAQMRPTSAEAAPPTPPARGEKRAADAGAPPPPAGGGKRRPKRRAKR